MDKIIEKYFNRYLAAMRPQFWRYTAEDVARAAYAEGFAAGEQYAENQIRAEYYDRS